MILTGKCKEDFYSYYEDLNIPHYYINVDFESLDDSMQYGVYVDFFDSVKIVIELQLRTSPTMQGGVFTCIRPSILSDGKFHNVGASFVVRERARIVAIKKVNEIYNLK